MLNDLLTANELAERLRLTPGHVRYLARTGQIPGLKPRSPKGHWRFDPEAVTRALRGQRDDTSIGHRA